MAIDGTCLDVADTGENAGFFGRPGVNKGEQAAFPQARIVALAECGTHAVFAAEIGTYSVSEATLSERLLPRLEPGMLLLADRGSFSYALWRTATATGADLLWRIRTDAHGPRAQHVRDLQDGSWLALLQKSTDRTSEPMLVRMVDYTVDDGRENTMAEWEGAAMRILVYGAGVIGSVYAGKLMQAGHEVVLVARGRRLSDLQTHGLVLELAQSGQRTVLRVPLVSEATGGDERYDLILVPVRYEQLSSTLPVLTAMTDGSAVLFFGNTIGRQRELTAALGNRALFGFPAAGGVRDGEVIRYVLIDEQKTMFGEPNGTTTPRVRHLQGVLNGAGFSTKLSPDIGGWLVAHTAFVVPLAFALYRVGVDASRLAADPATMRLMVRATRQAFIALRAAGNGEIPRNLRILYRLPTVFVVAYWRRVLASPRGELWFGAHTRAAPDEMRSLARQLQEALRITGGRTPDLDRLLATSV